MTRFDRLFDSLSRAPEELTEPELVSTEAQLHVDSTPSIGGRPSKAKSNDPSYVRTTVYLPKSLHKKLKSIAADEEREMSEIMTDLVSQWIETKAKEPNI